MYVCYTAGSPPPTDVIAGGPSVGVQVCGGRCGDLSCALSFSTMHTLSQHVKLGQLQCTTVSTIHCQNILYLCVYLNTLWCEYCACECVVPLLLFVCIHMYIHVFVCVLCILVTCFCI